MQHFYGVELIGFIVHPRLNLRVLHSSFLCLATKLCVWFLPSSQYGTSHWWNLNSCAAQVAKCPDPRENVNRFELRECQPWMMEPHNVVPSICRKLGVAKAWGCWTPNYLGTPLQTDLIYCCMLLQNQHYIIIYVYNVYTVCHYIHSSVSVNNQSNADYADFATATITTWRQRWGRHKRLRNGADGKVTWIRACPGPSGKSLSVLNLLKSHFWCPFKHDINTTIYWLHDL